MLPNSDPHLNRNMQTGYLTIYIYPDEMVHFIRVCKVCKYQTNLYNSCFMAHKEKNENTTCV